MSKDKERRNGGVADGRDGKDDKRPSGRKSGDRRSPRIDDTGDLGR